MKLRPFDVVVGAKNDMFVILEGTTKGYWNILVVEASEIIDFGGGEGIYQPGAIMVDWFRKIHSGIVLPSSYQVYRDGSLVPRTR